jgi:hypothetical protein
MSHKMAPRGDPRKPSTRIMTRFHWAVSFAIRLSSQLLAGINITVGQRPSAEQNADMAVYRILCTDIMADRFVSLIYLFLPLLLQIFLTKSVIFNTCKQRFRLLDNHRIWLRDDNVISCVKKNISYLYILLPSKLSLILCNFELYWLWLQVRIISAPSPSLFLISQTLAFGWQQIMRRHLADVSL